MLKWKKAARVFAAMLALMLMMQAACIAETAAVHVSSAEQVADGVILYANLVDAYGFSSGEEGTFAAENYSVQIDGGAPMAADAVMPIKESGRGTHYVICVDISASIKKDQMPNIISGLSDFVLNVLSDYPENDRVSLFSFGDAVTQLQDASMNAAEVANSIKSLTRKDQNTHLYEAIFAAVSKAREVKPDLPANCVMILITDGTDDPIVGQYNETNTRHLVEESQVPIYTIAIRQNGDQPLNNLQEFSQISGGYLRLTESTNVGAELANVRELAESTLLVHLPLRNDGSAGIARMQTYLLTLNRNGAAIQDSMPLKFQVDWSALPTPVPTQAPTPVPMATASPTPLPPSASPAAPATPGPTFPPTTPEPTVPATAEPTKAPGPAWLNQIKVMLSQGNAWILYVAAFLLIALIVLVVLLIVNCSRGAKNRSMIHDTVNSMRRMEDDPEARTVRGEYDDYGSDGGTIRSTAMPAGGYGADGGTIRVGGMPAGGYGSNDGYGSGTIRMDDPMADLESSGTIRLDSYDAGVQLMIEEQCQGAVQTHTVFVERELMVGRRESCGFHVSDGTVSGEHLMIRREEDGLYVQDLNSQNGTKINGERIRTVCRLHSGDTVLIGRTTLRIHFDE